MPKWFHSIDLGNGEITPGIGKPLDMIDAEAAVVFKHGVAGKSVLDIGAWDGAFSFEAERRGARDVLATDDFCWSGVTWGTKACFDYAHAKLNSKVRSLLVDVHDHSVERVGQFDVVLFLGVFYHLKSPLTGLEIAAGLARERLVIETLTGLNDLDEPVMRFLQRFELANDPTNYWVPNMLCLERMLKQLGFTKVEFELNPYAPVHDRYNRHIVHAAR
jgi:tRNA (mo5U34)-methyltransferase